MQPFKNILFDLGGVLLDIDFKATNKAFTALGVYDFELLFSQHHANDLFEQLETGLVSPEQFYGAFRKAVALPLSDQQIREAWNAMLLRFSVEKMQWLDQLKKHYNIYLFSNTNQIHFDYFTALCERQMNGRQLNSYFTKAWYSHELGLRKPYPEAFSAILEQGKLLAHETLFIDDTVENIEGAQIVGIEALHLEKSKSVMDLPL